MQSSDRDASQVQKDFNRIAEAYSGVSLESYLYMADILKVLPGKSSFGLEVGVGLGTLAVQLAKRCEHLVLVDISFQMAAQCQSLLSTENNVSVICGNALSVSETCLAQGLYDFVVCEKVLHDYLDIENRLRILKCYLKPGGVLVIVDFMRKRNVFDCLLGAIEMYCKLLSVSYVKYKKITIKKIVKSIIAHYNKNLWGVHRKRENRLSFTEACERYDSVLGGCQLSKLDHNVFLCTWTCPGDNRQCLT